MAKNGRIDEQGRKKSILKSITPGERLRLRDDALGHVQPRQWIFKRIESDDTILLMDESGGFGWSVKIDNIDWEAYEKQKGERLSHQN
jgi:hypothetical protein